MIKVPDENSEIPWDIKTLKLSLGGICDENGFVTFEIFDDDRFCIYAGNMDSPKWFCEDIDIEAARRLRDFLNYAVPNV
jgi:hypothetical protein